MQNMRLLYLNYPICQTLSGKLSWSHYCELLSISDKGKRSFYEKEAVNSGWSVRELRRQIESSLFERLLLSCGDANKEKVLALAKKGVDYTKPEDINPYQSSSEKRSRLCSSRAIRRRGRLEGILQKRIPRRADEMT